MARLTQIQRTSEGETFERLLTIKEVADWLAMDEKDIGRLVRLRQIEHHDFDCAIRFTPAQVRAYLDSTRRPICVDGHTNPAKSGSTSDPKAHPGKSAGMTPLAAKHGDSQPEQIAEPMPSVAVQSSFLAEPHPKPSSQSPRRVPMIPPRRKLSLLSAA